MEYAPTIADLFAAAALGSLVSALIFAWFVGLSRRGECDE